MRTFSNVTVIQIQRWDWTHPQSICLRLQPILKPKAFRRRVRAILIPMPSSEPDGSPLGTRYTLPSD